MTKDNWENIFKYSVVMFMFLTLTKDCAQDRMIDKLNTDYITQQDHH
jgi:hypothetical protein